MLSQEDYIVIKTLKARGVYTTDIAAELGVHPKTVSRALKRGSAPKAPRAPRSSKLDPYKPQIDHLLTGGVWNAVVILREIQAAGYAGGITIVREYVTPKRALRPSKATVRFETPAGRQLQSDWGEQVTVIAEQEMKVHFRLLTAVPLLVHGQRGCGTHLRRLGAQFRAFRRGDRRSAGGQSENGGAGTPGRPSAAVQCAFYRPGGPLWLSAARLPTVSSANQGQG